MKTFTFLVTLLLVGLSLYAQDYTLNIANISFAEGELVSKENRNNYDANGQLGAGLIIESNLEGLTFQSLNGIIRQEKNGNQSKLLISPEERIVTVFSDGFLPLEIILRDIGVNLESGTFWRLQIVGNSASNITALAIRVEPSDAKIYLNDQLQDSNNILELEYGLYELKIEKAGFSSISDLFKIDENNGQFLVKEYKLDIESYQKVTINGFPQNTDIYIDGIKQEGVSGSTFSTNLYPGTYDFSFLNQDYFLKEQQVTIAAGSDINLPITLQKNSSYFTTNIEPADSEVWINSEKYLSNQTIELRPGKYPITIIKSGYDTVFDTLEFRVGDRIEKDYSLKNSSGSISIKVTPSFSEAFINRKKISSSQLLANGKYELLVTANNYSEYSEVFEIVNNDNITRDISLNPIYTSINIKTNIDDAEIKLFKDSKLIASKNGLLELDQLFEGEYFIEVNKLGYRDIKESFFVYKNIDNSRVYELEEIPSIFDDPNHIYELKWSGTSHNSISNRPLSIKNYPEPKNVDEIPIPSNMETGDILYINFVIDNTGRLHQRLGIEFEAFFSQSKLGFSIREEIRNIMSNNWQFTSPECVSNIEKNLCNAAGTIKILKK